MTVPHPAGRPDGGADLERILSAAALRRLPRFLVIGVPGAGKSAVFEAAGFRRAMPPDETSSEWVCWLGERMVAVEAPGAPLRAGKQGAGDRKSWKAHLTALQRSRPARPLDGAIAALRLDFPGPSFAEEMQSQSAAVRTLLDETSNLLGTRPPLAVLFTHADRLRGFGEFFGPAGREAWEAPLGEWLREPRPYAAGWANAAFDRLSARLGAMAPDRIAEAADARARAAAFAFPSGFADVGAGVLGALGELAAASPLLGFGFASAPAPDRAFFLRQLLADTLPAAAVAPRPQSRKMRFLKPAGLAAAVLASVALLTGWGLTFARERTLIASTSQALADIEAGSGAVLRASSVSAPDFENVLEALGALHDLPVAPGVAGKPPVWETWLGLSRRASLAAAAEAAYGQALERLFRPRLMLTLQESVVTGLRQPDALYPPLKVYLMLGGAAPVADDGLVLGWARQDWETNRYPGSANRGGREQLRTHLEAMLRLDDGRALPPLVDRALVETAQRALARMDMPDRALALIQSSTYSAELPAFSLATAAGPQASALFETASGRAVASLSVPGLYTAEGFAFFLDQLATVAGRLEQDQWVMGAGGETVGVEERLKRLGPDLLDRYSRAFMAAWSDMLGQLRLKPLSADAPDYVALTAASAADSPLRRLVETVAAETGVNAAAGAFEGSGEAAEGLARIGIAPLPAKSQSRAGGAFSADFASPGAAIESRFRPFRMLVAGEPGQRPIDILVRNLADIRQSLQAGDEAHSARLQLQVLNLRTNASRLPPPLAAMLQTAADAFESEVVEASISQLDQLIADTIGTACRSALADAFPFGRNGRRDLPVSDFARLFGPNGEFDRFFAQNLASLVDITGRDWRWRPNTRLGRDLATEPLQSFQRAAEIRDAFFRPGSSTPGVSLTFNPVSLSKDAEMALLEVNGSSVHAYADGNVPVSVTWPDAGADGVASLALTPAIPGRQSALRFDGPWALLRLMAAGTRSVAAAAVELRFVVGGRDVSFTATSDARLNLFSLPLLEEFKCPTGL